MCVAALLLGACDDGASRPGDDGFAAIVDSERAALLSVHGTAADDVWAVGADDGTGPVVLHWDGGEWERRATGVRGDLWWVHALDDGTVYMAGTEAHVLRYADGEFTRLATPGLGRHTVFGIWAAAPDDIYAVGAEAGRNGFVWHYDGEAFEVVPLPPGLLPEDGNRDIPGLFKVWGHSGDDIWIVGGRGVALRGNARDGFEAVDTGAETTLFAVHVDAEGHAAMVGGENAGLLLEAPDGIVEDHTPELTALLQGVYIGPDGTTWATGQAGDIYRGRDGQYAYVDHGIAFDPTDSLHAVWVDPGGGVWTVGGNVLSDTLDRGRLLHMGSAIASFELTYEDEEPSALCPPEAVDIAPWGSIARRWNEQLLNAVRRDLPRPTVHARNLYHQALAMWDANAAYDAAFSGVVVDEQVTATDIEAERQEAMSYAVYRVLTHRYESAVGGAVSQACFDAFMEVLGYDIAMKETDGDTPAAVGNRIARAVIDEFADDGANEGDDYTDPQGFSPNQPELVVDNPGTDVNDPLTWQKLVLAEAVTQNGIPEGSGTRDYVGAHWGQVEPFALPPGTIAKGGALDVGSPPTEFDDALIDAVVDVLRHGAELDVDDGVMIDISPAAMGNHPLGSNDGIGYAQNPITGKPYARQPVLRGDFARVMAEFWADGPTSETPPGHWNTLANQLADRDDLSRRLFGEGPQLSQLAWDLHVYLALNGALHDAAIGAWGLKRTYLSSRPITLIRHMASLGQRSDPDGPAYDAGGLPLEGGLIEVITQDSAAPGQRHAHLARYVGEIAIFAWRGEPGDRDREIGHVGWIRGIEWIPYQRRTFVTPAFPGYISGHSTFSRAGAEVLTQITGSPYFPGGLGTYRVEPGYLVFEYGPTAPIELQWARYYDAADQAGRSRLWGGIHIRHDDFDGRVVGSMIGQMAITRAREIMGLPAQP